jgi:hypothetical protein
VLLQAVDSLWPWLAIAGLGALHGLSPTSGWMFATAWGLREGGAAQAWRALPPIAIGQATSMVVVAFLFARGAALDPVLLRIVAGALLVGAAAVCLRRGARRQRPFDREARHAGIAIWTFLMGSAHSAGLLLVPAPLPMCLDGGAQPAVAISTSLMPALAAVTLHTAAMLLTTGAIASGVCRSLALHPRGLGDMALRKLWPTVLAITGALLMASA